MFVCENHDSARDPGNGILEKVMGSPKRNSILETLPLPYPFAPVLALAPALYKPLPLTPTLVFGIWGSVLLLTIPRRCGSEVHQQGLKASQTYSSPSPK